MHRYRKEAGTDNQFVNRKCVEDLLRSTSSLDDKDACATMAEPKLQAISGEIYHVWVAVSTLR